IVVINLSAIATMFYRNRAPETFPRFRNRNMRENRSMQINRNSFNNNRRRGAHDFFVNELDFSEKQLAIFREISQNKYTKIRILINKLNDKRDEMIFELDKENPNMKKLDTIAYEVGNLHVELKKITINHYLEIKDICNIQQKEKLHLMYKHMLPDKCPTPDLDEQNRRGRHNRQHRNQNTPNY
ncbi:MAG: hypothetical protein U9R54_08800, partial [Bacteroidota bacterium]|nr:hypothetical protein [Bacteroidota bacterium]